MRAMSWAIRVTYANGREAFLRRGARPGYGPIATFRTRRDAEDQAAFLREGLDARDVVTVIERSHGKRTDPEQL